jgi:hypothetical protein
MLIRNRLIFQPLLCLLDGTAYAAIKMVNAVSTQSRLLGAQRKHSVRPLSDKGGGLECFQWNDRYVFERDGAFCCGLAPLDYDVHTSYPFWGRQIMHIRSWISPSLVAGLI